MTPQPEASGGTAGRLVAGVELGGTKCIVTLAGDPGTVVDRQLIPTTDPAATIAAIEAVLAGWRGRGAEALGIASFGPVDLDPASPTYGSITATPKRGWEGIDLLRRLERGTGLPAAFDTDVNGAALAEMRWGAGRGLTDFAYVTIGTGVGVGLIVNGAATRGFGHCELGHMRVPRLAGDEWPGSCPYHGDCVEGLASGSALAARLGDRDVATLTPDDPIWTGIAHAAAQLCHAIVCAAAPHRIVIGGGVPNRQPHLLAMIETMLRDSLAGYVELPAGAGGYVTAPALGDEAGAMGPIAMGLRLLEDR